MAILLTGRVRYSIWDIVNAFEKIMKKNYRIIDRRHGNIALCYANCSKANEELRINSKQDIRRYAQKFLEFY